ncbi:general odorant-binding protein 45-like [Uranotaenia lowii]|uniref:general odorant-binding protein 45-like n=1 Tax=Uranotaenia lowii TaxID=190385 RepID=UPI00247AABCB|nr:general odorant-binding protein 45-like [Uranotaenia lowii]
MGFQFSSVCLPILLAAVCSANHQHAISHKSPGQITSECQQYLRSPDSECEHRCGFILTRNWDTCVGSVNGPTPWEQQYAYEKCRDLRKSECMIERFQNTGSEDVCQRGNVTFDCLQEEIGPLDFSQVHFVRNSWLHTKQIVKDCVDIHQIPVQDLQSIADNGFGGFEAGRCLLRCFALRSGYFQNNHGPKLDRLETQFVGSVLFRDRYRPTKQLCLADFVDQCYGCVVPNTNCTIVSNFIGSCFADDIQADASRAIWEQVYES